LAGGKLRFPQRVSVIGRKRRFSPINVRGARGIFEKIPRVGVGRSPTAFFPSFYTKPEKISTVISRKWSFLSK
jgi:hypothetical protein